MINLHFLQSFNEYHCESMDVVRKHTFAETNKILKKMVRTLEQISADSYVRRVMEEQEFDELEVNILQNTIAAISAERDNAWNALAQKDTALAEKDTALVALQNQLAEYRIKYGTLDL